jgi:ribosome-binding protein aMBF1 (putative translation factor)
MRRARSLRTTTSPPRAYCVTKGSAVKESRDTRGLDMAAARRIPLEKPPTKAEATKVDRLQKAMLLRIGTRLKRMRTASGLSLRAFAMRADCSPTYLSEIERGDRSISVEFLVRVSHFLGVHPTIFISDEEN